MDGACKSYLACNIESCLLNRGCFYLFIGSCFIIEVLFINSVVNYYNEHELKYFILVYKTCLVKLHKLWMPINSVEY